MLRENKKEVQEYLDAIVDEIRISDSDSEFNFEKVNDKKLHVPKEFGHQLNVPSQGHTGHSLSTQLPKISVTTSLNGEMEQYLFGYGEDYGGPSSVNILPGSRRKAKENGNDDINSVEVQTSLDSSANEYTDDDMTADTKLPTEKESVFDQVQRLQASIEQHDMPNKKVTLNTLSGLLLIFVCKHGKTL